MTAVQTDDAATTRAQILQLIVTQGPITASDLARRLHLAAAGIRRHLSALESGGLICQLEAAAPGRGRGRPPRHYVAAPRAQEAFASSAADLALDALAYLVDLAGPSALDQFALAQGSQFEDRYGAVVAEAGPDIAARAQALAQALSADGYAASIRPGPAGSLTLQLCQGHCPVHRVAAEFPKLCQAETRAIARMLGVHVQRLATLAGGEHVCTTCVPVAPAPTSAPAPQPIGVP